MQETTKSKWWRQRHLVLTSQMRTVWSSDPECEQPVVVRVELDLVTVRVRVRVRVESWP